MRRTIMMMRSRAHMDPVLASRVHASLLSCTAPPSAQWRYHTPTLAGCSRTVPAPVDWATHLTELLTRQPSHE
jgi:hypothetical protein